MLEEIARIGAGMSSDLTQAQVQCADVNLDGSLDAYDAALILVYTAETGSGKFVRFEDLVPASS